MRPVLLSERKKNMKEAIENKLKEHLEMVLRKDYLLADDLNFLVFMLNRIETKEIQEMEKEEREKSNQQWREKMKNMIEGVMENG